ncbi:hypothetical protein LguiB_026782 [Lonicera macranthoides]
MGIWKTYVLCDKICRRIKLEGKKMKNELRLVDVRHGQLLIDPKIITTVEPSLTNSRRYTFDIKIDMGGPGKRGICAGYIRLKGCIRRQCIHKCFIKYSGTQVTEAACDSADWCLCCYNKHPQDLKRTTFLKWQCKLSPPIHLVCSVEKLKDTFLNGIYSSSPEASVIKFISARVSDLILAPGVPPSRARPPEIFLRGKLISVGGLLCLRIKIVSFLANINVPDSMGIGLGSVIRDSSKSLLAGCRFKESNFGIQVADLKRCLSSFWQLAQVVRTVLWLNPMPSLLLIV